MAATSIQDLRKLHVQVSDDALFQELEGEAVLLSTKTGEYYGVDEVGTRIWNLLEEEGKRADEVVAILLEEYEVSEERLATDVLAFLRELAANGLVVLDERAS